jgi:transcriptional regulator with XRE-family HTH domain
MLSKYRQRQALNFNLEKLGRYLIDPPPHGWIKTYRYLFDLSQSDLARLLGVSQKRVDLMEENEINARIELSTLINIADAFESDFYYIFIPKRPLEEIRSNLIKRSYQRKFGCEVLAEKATSQKISRLKLRGIYGQDPKLF